LARQQKQEAKQQRKQQRQQEKRESKQSGKQSVSHTEKKGFCSLNENISSWLHDLPGREEDYE
jgi:hypothetical protein